MNKQLKPADKLNQLGAKVMGLPVYSKLKERLLFPCFEKPGGNWLWLLCNDSESAEAWNPMEDLNQAWMLADLVLRQENKWVNFSIDRTIDDGLTRACFVGNQGEDLKWVDHDSPATALLVAALLASGQNPYLEDAE